MWFSLYARLLYFLSDFKVYLILDFLTILLLVWGIHFLSRSSYSHKKKRVLLLALSSFFAFVVTYNFFEAYTRYKFDESDSLGFLKVNGRWLQRHVVFNNYYVRDRDFQREKKKDVTRIVVIGDSIAFGYGIKDVNNRFSNILEKKLLDAHKNSEVYNFGVSGSDTDSELEQYNTVIKDLDPDIIVWEYFLNDAQPQNRSTGTKVLDKERTQGKIVSFLSSQSYFFDYIYWRLSAKYEKIFRELRNVDIEAYKDEENLQRHKKDVETFINRLQEDNKKIIVVVFPFLYSFPHYPAADIHKTVDAIFQEHGIQPMDLLDDLKGKQTKDLIVSRYDYHPNESVHRFVAEKLYNKILPLLTDESH